MILLNVDLSDLIKMRQEMEPRIHAALRQAAEDLARQTHAYILEEVQKDLHSSREKYVAALDVSQHGEAWLVTLDKKAMFIEEGLPEHEMLDDLLSSPKAKTARDGSRYLVVPFEHSKGPTGQTPAGRDLTDTIKGELKRRKIPYGKTENDAQTGQPKQGLLHSIDIMKAPLKTRDGPGQGKGPVGSVRQGPTGIPFLQGIRVYQKQMKDHKTGKSFTKRSVMTFRIASSKHKGSGRWVHPGLEAKRFFERAQDWAIQEWERRVAPDIINRLSREI